MCVPETVTLTIALFGKSCVGKSTVAKELGRLLHWPIRHCGEAVKAQARRLECDPAELPAQLHSQIDEETRQQVTRSGPKLIVEGRFLNHVLSGVSSVALIELTCTDAERLKRAQAAGNGDEFIVTQDTYSASFCRRTYRDVAPAPPLLQIPTENLFPNQIAELIIKGTQPK